MLANIAYILKITIPSITPLWSVGVEEQFYLIWPFIVKKSTHYIRVFTALILTYLIIKSLAYITLTPNSVIFKLIEITRIDIMFLGALGAYLVYSNHTLLKIIFRIEIQIIAWAVLFISIFYQPIHLISFLDNEINSIFYFIIILNISSNKNSIISLESKITNFLGEISYGIYVYHMIIIYTLSYIANLFHFHTNYITTLLLIILSTILTSWLSYNVIEKPFLKIKRRYSVVKSTNINPSSKL